MDTVVRVALIYAFLLVGFRVLGKRELSQLSPFELVTLLLIPEILSQALVAEASLANALAGVTTIFVLVFATSVLSHRFKKVGDLLEGQAVVVVRDGKLVESALNKERVNPDEILGEMHKSGLERLEQVKWGILETDGHITLIPYGPMPVLRRGDDATL